MHLQIVSLFRQVISIASFICGIVRIVPDLLPVFRAARMDIKIRNRTANKLDLEVFIHHEPQNTNIHYYTSPEYLCGTVYFQLQADCPPNSQGTIVVTAKYCKAFANDNMQYNCRLTVTYNHYSGDEQHKLNIIEDQNWHVILRKMGKLSMKFDVCVQFDLVTPVTPFSSLYEDTELTDFVLKAEDGSVSVHSAVVAGASPVLKKMLTGNWQETSERSVTIPDVTKETLENLKEYMYLGKIPETGLENLLLLGSCYLIPDLVQRCAVKILFLITSDNIIYFVQFAVQYKLEFLLVALMKLANCQGLVNNMILNWNDLLQPSSAVKD